MFQTNIVVKIKTQNSIAFCR